MRGATTAQVLRLESVEAVVVSVGGTLLGLALAALTVRFLTPDTYLFDQNTWRWTLGASLIGLALAIGTVLAPTWRQARHSTVAAGRQVIGRARAPLWQRWYLDVIVLAIAGVVFWRTAGTGYQLVLAPEGVPQTSVSYEAFLAPLGLWIGVGLLALRLWNTGLQHGGRVLRALVQPFAHGLSGVVAGALSRQRRMLTRGIVLVALAFAFAVSTALFNTTYAAQARVDAELTNGADVQVSGTTTNPPGSMLAQLAALPGVSAAQPLHHRFAYVGTDLQDIFGIDPQHIGDVAHMANAYFANGDAQATLARLSATPDGVLVSEETVKDFQLSPGDVVNLRLQNAQDNQYHVVPFHFIGIVREFPTAPKDSFLVANASYIAQQTGTDAAETVLLRTSGEPTTVAQAAQALMQHLPGITVKDIGATQRVIDSGLTAVDLRGLTTLQLAFAVLLVAGATGLVLALSLAERRRSFAILTALGANARQLGAWTWSEGMLLLVGGALVGSVTGVVLAQMLVMILTHVFDPPPEALAVPWRYMALLGLAGVLSTLLAVTAAHWASRRFVTESLREL